MHLAQQADRLKINNALGGSAGRLRLVPILSIAVILRIVMASLMIKHLSNMWFYNQASELGCLGQSIVEGHGLASPFCGSTGPSAFLAPGYPLFVALAFGLFGIYSIGATTMIIACQIVLGVLVVLSTMMLARTLFSVRVANATGVVCAVSPTLIWLPVLFWETSFTMMCLTSILAYTLHCIQNPLRLSWAMLGILCGTAVLVNPALMLTLVAVFLWAMYRSQPLHRHYPLIAFVTCTLAFASWPVRNFTALHAFVPMRTNFGYELWQGNKAGSTGEFSPILHLNVNRVERSRYAQIGEMAYMHEKSTAAMNVIQADPLRFLKLSIRRAVRFWFGLSAKHNSILVITDLSLTSLLGLTGLAFLAKHRHSNAILLALPLLLFPLPYYITHADFRFRLVLDPIAIMLSVYAVHALSRLPTRHDAVSSLEAKMQIGSISV